MLSAVISKMKIDTSRDFGSGWLTKLSCICQNDLMAAYAESDEDKLFTKYSPWGEAQLGACLKPGWVETARGYEFYMVALRGDEPKCPKGLHKTPCRVVSVTDFGDGQAKVLEVASRYAHKTGFNLKMSIDNPPAVEFFVPGRDDYWVVFYPAEEFTKDTALADALGR